jgi:hypothetical protein
MAEPLHLPPETGPATEQLQLGGQTLEMDRDTARAVRDQFEQMAANYQAALDTLRAQQLQAVGTPWQGPLPVPQGPEPLTVPDPDILFQNKQGWTDAFTNSLEQQLGGVRQENVQMVQGLAQAFQQELARRDAASAARATHDAAMNEMLERRGLGEHTLVVQAIYNQEYDKLRNLPLEFALDKIGALAEEEIDRIRSGEQWTIRPVQGGGATSRPPAMLRSSRRAARAPAAAPAAPETLQDPGGGLGMLGKIIRKRQAVVMGSAAE